jgi:hypothetical protein
MKSYNPEDTFVCVCCGHEVREYYRSEENEEQCIHCDPVEDQEYYNLDDEGDYYEDDSGSPWNE